MNKWSELLIGLILIIGVIIFSWYSQQWGTFNFWNAAWEVLKGGIVWFILGVGFLFVLLGISDLKG